MSEWMPIETAAKDVGKEILGVRYAGGVMIREPFISFWSPTLGKFFAGPTHWVPMPARPKAEDSASKTDTAVK